MLLARKGVTVHAVFPGPVDTDMTRDLELPQASAESVAVAIFDGLQNGDEDIFPDPMSQSIAAHRRRQGSRAAVHGIRAASRNEFGLNLTRRYTCAQNASQTQQ